MSQDLPQAIDLHYKLPNLSCLLPTSATCPRPGVWSTGSLRYLLP